MDWGNKELERSFMVSLFFFLRVYDSHFKQTKGDRKMATILGGRFPITTLNNGLTVVNYGSNHIYTFTDGNVLGGCTDDICHATELLSDHTGIAQVLIDKADTRLTVDVPQDRIDTWRDYVLQKYPEYEGSKMWLDMFINYQISDRIQNDLLMITEMDIIDVILAPYPLVNAWDHETRMMKEIVQKSTELDPELMGSWEYVLLKLRTCKLEDRVTKIIYSDRFCGSEESRLIEVTRNPQSVHSVE